MQHFLRYLYSLHTHNISYSSKNLLLQINVTSLFIDKIEFINIYSNTSSKPHHMRLTVRHYNTKVRRECLCAIEPIAIKGLYYDYKRELKFSTKLLRLKKGSNK